MQFSVESREATMKSGVIMDTDIRQMTRVVVSSEVMCRLRVGLRSLTGRLLSRSYCNLFLKFLQLQGHYFSTYTVRIIMRSFVGFYGVGISLKNVEGWE